MQTETYLFNSAVYQQKNLSSIKQLQQRNQSLWSAVCNLTVFHWRLPSRTCSSSSNCHHASSEEFSTQRLARLCQINRRRTTVKCPPSKTQTIVVTHAPSVDHSLTHSFSATDRPRLRAGLRRPWHARHNDISAVGLIGRAMRRLRRRRWRRERGAASRLHQCSEQSPAVGCSSSNSWMRFRDNFSADVSLARAPRVPWQRVCELVNDGLRTAAAAAARPLAWNERCHNWRRTSRTAFTLSSSKKTRVGSTLENVDGLGWRKNCEYVMQCRRMTALRHVRD